MALRWLKFILAIIVGIVLGLFYGWNIHPGNASSVTPEQLRIDYKTDYVLMVAETYLQDGDIEASLQRLASLGVSTPLETTLKALIFAQEIGYTQDDLGIIQNLLTALQVYSFTQETAAP